MRRILMLTVFWIAAQAVVLAQKFDVASVKVAAPVRTGEGGPYGLRAGGPGTDSPERASWRMTVLGPLIRQAYGVKNLQIVAPNWVTTFGDADTRYDINATMSPGTTAAQMDVMVRSLLEDRFGLKVHREMQERPVYALSVAKSGAKLKASTRSSDTPDGVGGGPRAGGGFELYGRRASMKGLGVTLELNVFRGESAIVVDNTGLNGFYEFSVLFAGVADVASGEFPSITTAFEQDLGLKLEKRKTMVEVVVVDSINKVPTAN
jgi:uncharacterized protein (TIGR03435 family)